MSLILDALRKLERDKQSRDPGVVVVGQVPWRGRDTSRRATLVILASLTFLVVAAAAAFVWLSRPDGSIRLAAPPDERLPAEAEVDRGPAGIPAVGLPPGAGPAPAAGAGESTAPEPPPTREIDLPGPVASRPAAGPAAAALPPEATDVDDATATGVAEATPAPGARPALLLTAISERDGRPVAVLNDRLVHEGDSVDGARVVRIGPTEVEVEIDGKRLVIGF